MVSQVTNIFEMMIKKFHRKWCGVHFPSSIQIVSPWDTLLACQDCIEKNIPGAYLRLGDGDVNLMEGRGELLQPYSPSLCAEMIETFSLSGKGIIKALPIHSPQFGMWEGMKPGIHEASDSWACDLLARCFEYFIGNYIYSPVALAHVTVSDRVFATNFMRFLKKQNPLFIGNENIPADILIRLFNSDFHIKTPSENSYASIERIEHEALAAIYNSSQNYNVVVVAMGCSGRVIAKRLIKDKHCNVFVFDFGSLMDAFCGWNTRAWIELVQVSDNYFDELIKQL